MPTAEGQQSLEPVSQQHSQLYDPQLVELEGATALAEAVRKSAQKTELDASGDSVEYHMKAVLAEAGSVREHMALRLVEADSVEAECCTQAGASSVDEPLAAAWLQVVRACLEACE